MMIVMGMNIMNDAYFGINFSQKKYMYIYGVFAIGEFIMGAIRISDEGLRVNGVITLEGGIFFVCGIFFMVFTILLLVKQIKDRKEEAE